LGILGCFRLRERHASQNNVISQFKLWAQTPLQISASLCEGPIYLLLCNFYFFWVSIFSYKAPTREHYYHTWSLDVANIWVCFMNGSMIEHNGLGIAFFSVDILKDMVACWYAWVLRSSCQIIDYCFESSKVQMSKRKEYVINMMGSIPHQKFCFYHLPTRGRAWIKLGDAWYVSNVSIMFYCSMLL
jgi:hypothetical protein